MIPAQPAAPVLSVLQPAGVAPPVQWPAGAALFTDLNLDQIIAGIVAGKEEYDLEPLLRSPLQDPASIEYRHAVFADLGSAEVRDHIERFARGMRQVVHDLGLAGKLRHAHQRSRWFLAAVSGYCDTVHTLAEALAEAPIRSAALAGVRDYLSGYLHGARFCVLHEETRQLIQALAQIRYTVLLAGDRVRVGYCHDEPDYSENIAATFDKFRQGVVKNYLIEVHPHEEMNHVEAQILDGVARLFTRQFEALAKFCSEHADFADPTVTAFDREAQFYLGYLHYVAPLRESGLRMSCPRVSAHAKAERAEGTFDLALAVKLQHEGVRTVTNDLRLDPPERLLVISGPNQGGKTTLARTFGQLHYLAKLGVPVPGEHVTLLLCDGVYTHFERPENLDDLHGKLQDDLVRIHQILERVTPRSVVILNEIFTSTTLQDAITLSTAILRQLIERNVLSVCVTFIDELSTLSDSTVSMVSTVEPDRPAVRTFKVLRRPADGRAYAQAIAERYGLTYAALRTRIAP